MMNTNNQTSPRIPFPRKYLIGAAVLAVLVALIMFLTAYAPFVTIPTGHTGVVTTFGRVADYTLDEGFHLKSPLQKVVLIDNRTQRATVSTQAFSSDIQQVNLICSINYSVDRETSQRLYQQVGSDYYHTVMEPRIHENVKTVFTRYSAEKLMEARNVLSTQVKDLLAPEMKAYGIEIISVAIEDVDFTDAFTDAVEAKQVAEQTKLKVETEQAQQVSVQQSEAERRIIAANAEAQERAILANADAEVLRIQAEAARYAGEKEAEKNAKIANSLTPELLEYFKITGWNGQLPQFYSGNGSTLPVLNFSLDSLLPGETATDTDAEE